jgi:hypothetical protein
VLETRMKRITARHRQAVGLVVNGGRTMASVGREYGVTAGTVRRWIDAIYTPPPPPPKSPRPSLPSAKSPQEMVNMYGWPIEIWHKQDSPFPQRYSDLNTSQRRKLRENYVVHFQGRCIYCDEPLNDKPHEFVRAKATSIWWPNLPGGRKGFLSNSVHLHHDHETDLTLGPVHALCNAHSYHFYELPRRRQKLDEMIERMPDPDVSKK